MVRSAPWGAALTALILVGCSTGDRVSETTGSGGGGTGSLHGGGPTGPGPAGAGGSGGSGGSGAAHLDAPPGLSLPYVIAGTGGSTASLVVRNDGDAPLTGPNGVALVWTLQGDPSLSMGSGPAKLDPGESASIDFTYAGATVEAIARADLSVATNVGTTALPIYGVAGDPGLGTGTWDDVHLPQGILAGRGITVAMPTAPFPYSSGPYTDPSVHVFLPDGYRERGSQDLVVHFHGWGTTIAETLPAHLYREQVYTSGANDVLVVPQGPVDDSSGDFGKLMVPGGLAALAREVLVLLYREGAITFPELGDVALTSHSGGYVAVALNILPTNGGPTVRQVNLFDSLYDDQFDSFRPFAETTGNVFRSAYTLVGGTDGENISFAQTLTGEGFAVGSTPSQNAFRDEPIVICEADTTHDGSTRLDAGYSETLRWGARHSRNGPRIELREVVKSGGQVTARWLSPVDEDTTGFAVQTSTDGVKWTTATTVAATEDHATFALQGGARVRVHPVTTGVADPLASDVYRVDDAPTALVVDGFSRVLDGSYGGLSHSFSAVVGEALGHVATISNNAVTEDGFDLSAWPVVVWLLGDESVMDHSLSDAEQAAISAYLAGGGQIVVSGSEVGYDLDTTASGPAFLAATFGLSFGQDDSNSYSVSGKGPLASLPTFTYSGTSAPYQEDYPDAFALDGGVAVLDYASGTHAAVGIAGRSVLVGFPLELIDDPAARAAAAKALVGFVNP